MPTRLLLGMMAVLVVAGAIGTVHFQRQSEQHAARAAALERDLAQARAEAARERERTRQITAQAAELDTQLGHAKIRTTATESKFSQVNRELDAARSSLTERQQREVTLLAAIESLRQRIKDAEAAPVPPSRATVATVAAPETTLVAGSAPPPSALPLSQAALNHAAEPSTTAASVSPTEIDGYRERISALEAQLAELLARALSEPPPAAPAPAAPPEPAGAGRVVRVGPGDAFVIVDYGRDQGAEIGDELTLCRGTTVVARVQISDARSRFSVAQVLPTALKRQLQPGDFVLIAK